jgi:hypothetical protein
LNHELLIYLFKHELRLRISCSKNENDKKLLNLSILLFVIRQYEIQLGVCLILFYSIDMFHQEFGYFRYTLQLNKVKDMKLIIKLSNILNLLKYLIKRKCQSFNMNKLITENKNKLNH